MLNVINASAAILLYYSVNYGNIIQNDYNARRKCLLTDAPCRFWLTTSTALILKIYSQRLQITHISYFLSILQLNQKKNQKEIQLEKQKNY